MTETTRNNTPLRKTHPIRKLIDYFCHLAVAPHAYADIQENDAEFAATSYLKAIAWLKDDADDLYDPSYGDVIRVAGLLGFSRGKASSIVSELSGRDPETARSTRPASRLPTTRWNPRCWRS